MNKQVENKIKELRKEHSEQPKQAFIDTGLEYVESIKDDVKKQVSVLNEMIETLNEWDGKADERVGVIVDINPEVTEEEDDDKKEYDSPDGKVAVRKQEGERDIEEEITPAEFAKAMEKVDELHKQGKKEEALKILQDISDKMTGGALNIDTIDKVIAFMAPKIAKVMDETDEYVESLGFKGDSVWKMTFATLQHIVEVAEKNIKNGHKPK